MSYIGNSPKANRLRLQPRSSDPVNPAEGDLQFADGSVREKGLWVYKNSAWVRAASSATGLVNYLTNPDAEAGNTSGWSLGNVTLTSKFPSGVPTFGSGANANLSFTNSSSSPIAGTRSFVYASSTATTAGNFLASDVFTIDSADLSKVLTIDLTYQITSGTIDASGTSNNSFGIAIYDVTASAWIQPAGTWAITQITGAGRAIATFQTPITSTQYRLVLFNANATSGAVTMKLDRLLVGPQSVPVAAPVTDWQFYTPTFQGFGTPNFIECYWRRNGPDLEITGRFSGGTPTAAEARVYFPSGLVSASNWSQIRAVGRYESTASTTASPNGAGPILIEPSVNYVTFGGESTGGISLTKQNGNAIIATNPVSYFATIPIAGWSSQVQMSSDTDTRVVAARARVGTAASTTAGNPFNFDTVDFDTHGAISTGATTWKYTVPVSGNYVVSTSIYLSGAAAIHLFKNGSLYCYLGLSISSNAPAPASTIVQCNAGDTLFISTGTTGTPTATASTTVTQTNWVSIHRLSGPSVVAASESVAARYTSTSGQSVTSATLTIIPFATKDYDTHNAYNTSTGVYTAPVSGKYRVSFQSVTAARAQSNNTFKYFALYKGGVFYSYISSVYIGLGGSTTAATYAGSETINLNAGDTIDLRFYSPEGSATVMDATAGNNHLSIERIGN